jgi:hypothetical protein
MIVYASPRTQGIDIEGDTQPISVMGPEQDSLKIEDQEQYGLLNNILKELKIMNLHLTSMTDNHIQSQDVEVS